MDTNSASVDLADLKPHLIAICKDKFVLVSLSLPDSYSVRSLFVLALKYDRTNEVINKMLQEKGDLREVNLQLMQSVHKPIYHELLSNSMQYPHRPYNQ